jgi:hypothetical protein
MEPAVVSVIAAAAAIARWVQATAGTAGAVAPAAGAGGATCRGSSPEMTASRWTSGRIINARLAAAGRFITLLTAGRPMQKAVELRKSRWDDDDGGAGDAGWGERGRGASRALVRARRH